MIAEPGQNVALLLAEILKSIRWYDVVALSKPEEAIAYATKSPIDVIIIDDRGEHPAPLVIRQLFAHPITALTPTMALVNRAQKNENNALATLGRPMVIEKPLSPGRFVNPFNTLLKVWSSGAYPDIRLINRVIAEGNKEEGIKSLMKLSTNPKALTTIAPTLSYYLRETNLAAAEKVLLTALKTAPRNLGIIISLVDFYLHNAMPATAQRLLINAESIFGNAICFSPDKFQVHYLLDQLTDSIDVLKFQKDQNIAPNLNTEYLARLFYTEGRIPEFRTLVEQGAPYDRFIRRWGDGKSAKKSAA